MLVERSNYKKFKGNQIETGYTTMAGYVGPIQFS
jgi:hypothetical protein